MNYKKHRARRRSRLGHYMCKFSKVCGNKKEHFKHKELSMREPIEKVLVRYY